MAAFRFQLDSLRKLRTIVRDRMRVRLGEALQAEGVLEQRQQELHQELLELKQRQRQSVASTEPDVNILLDLQRYEAHVIGQIQNHVKQIKTVQDEVEKRRSQLAEAEKDVRILDKLEDRKRAEFQKEVLRQEALELSEVATMQYLQRTRVTSTT